MLLQLFVVFVALNSIVHITAAASSGYQQLIINNQALTAISATVLTVGVPNAADTNQHFRYVGGTWQTRNYAKVLDVLNGNIVPGQAQVVLGTANGATSQQWVTTSDKYIQSKLTSILLLYITISSGKILLDQKLKAFPVTILDAPDPNPQITLQNAASIAISITLTQQISAIQLQTNIYTLAAGSSIIVTPTPGVTLTATSSLPGTRIQPANKTITSASEVIVFTMFDDFAGDDLTEAEKALIKQWFPTGTRFSRFYNASTDGWYQNNFTDNSEAKGPYLMIATSDDYKFGGYGPNGFTYAALPGVQSIDPDAFTFSLRNPSSTPRQFKAIGQGSGSYFSAGPWTSNFGKNDVVIDARSAVFTSDRTPVTGSMLDYANNYYYTGASISFLTALVAYQVDFTYVDGFAGSDLTDTEKQLIRCWFPPNTRFNRFYQASVDGWYQVNFTSNVAARSPYIIIATTADATPFKFGGYGPEGFQYAPLPGNSSTNPSAFAFSLRNPSNTPRQFRATISSTGTQTYFKGGPWHSNFGQNDVVIDTRRAAFYRDPYVGSMLETLGDTFYTGKKENFLQEIEAYHVTLQ